MLEFLTKIIQSTFIIEFSSLLLYVPIGIYYLSISIFLKDKKSFLLFLVCLGNISYTFFRVFTHNFSQNSEFLYFVFPIVLFSLFSFLVFLWKNLYLYQSKKFIELYFRTISGLSLVIPILIGVFVDYLGDKYFFLEGFGLLTLLLVQPANIARNFIHTNTVLQKISAELNKINELSKEINANTDIDYILFIAFRYIEANYSINSYWLQIVDTEKKDAYTYSYLFPKLLEKDEDSMIYYYRSKIPKHDITSKFYDRRKPNRPFYYRDVQEYPPTNIEKRILDMFRIKSIIQFPLLVQGEYVALLNFMSVEKYMNLNRNEIISLVRIAEQLAVAIKNSILLGELRIEKEKSERARKEIESISHISKLINSNSNLDMMLQMVYKHISTKYKIECYSLFFINSAKTELKLYKTNIFAQNKDLNIYNDKKISLHKGIHKYAFKKQKIIYVPSVTLTKFSNDEQHILKKYKITSILIVPLIVKEEVIGIFDFFNTNDKIYLQKSEIISISNFCNQITGSIHNSHLLEIVNESKRIAERSLFEIQKLNELTKTINSNIDLDIILLHISSYLESFFGISTLWLQLVDYRANELYTYNLSTIEIDEFDTVEFIQNLKVPIRPESGIYWKIFNRTKPVYLRRFRKIDSELEKRIVEIVQFKSIIIVPLVLHGKSIGIFNLTSLENPLKLNKKDILSISRFVEQVVGAIHNSTLLKEVQSEKEKADKLLLNILPAQVAEELKEKGEIKPVTYESVTILFTDFKGFTRIASKMPAEELLHILDSIFLEFDRMIDKYNIEKLKTIGDSYMCVGGIPKANNTHAVDICLAALELQNFVKTLKEAKEVIAGEDFWDMRVGIHTGPVVAGVIGKNKFAYDIWGDTVNIASRMETNGEEGMINISKDTYDLVKSFFDCEYRGKFHAKNKGMIDMFFLNGLQNQYKTDEAGNTKNQNFEEAYEKLKNSK